jgi:hypothetical protein
MAVRHTTINGSQKVWLARASPYTRGARREGGQLKMAKKKTTKKPKQTEQQKILEALKGIWGYAEMIHSEMPSGGPNLDRIEHTLDLILNELRSQGGR